MHSSFNGSSDDGQNFNFAVTRLLHMILAVEGKLQILHFVHCSLKASFSNLLFLTKHSFLIGPNLTITLFSLTLAFCLTGLVPAYAFYI